MDYNTRIEIVYQNVNITNDLAPSLLTFSWTDNEGKRADQISLTLMDSDNKWIGSWYPQKDDTITAKIFCSKNNGPERYVDCGVFKVTKIGYTGFPFVCTITADSASSKLAAKRINKSKSWETVTFKHIVDEIAKENGLESIVDIGSTNFTYKRIEQSNETQLQFLTRICDDEGYNLKISNNKLIVYSLDKYEDKRAQSLIRFKDITNFNLSSKSFSSYKSAEISYLDPISGKINKSVFGEGEPVLKINRRVESIEMAERQAYAAMRVSNGKDTEISLTMPGDTKLVAGILVELNEDFKKFSGPYIIKSATHTLGGTAYTTTLTLRRAQLNKSKQKASKSKKDEPWKNPAFPESSN